jgi:hypothetical protein
VNPTLLTAIAQEKMNDVARQAEAHRRERGDRPVRRVHLSKAGRRYFGRGDARNVEPLHRATA